MKKVLTQNPEKPEFSERGVREASHERSALTKHGAMNTKYSSLNTKYSALNTKHSAQQNESTLDAKHSSCTGHQNEHKKAHRITFVFVFLSVFVFVRERSLPSGSWQGW